MPKALAVKTFLSLLGQEARRAHAATALNVLLGLVCLVLAIALGIRSLASPITPYIVRVDSLGRVAAAGPAEAYKDLDDVVIAAELRRFLNSFRTVTNDPIIQKKSFEQTYAYIANGSEAYRAVSAELRLNDPRDLSSKFTRTTQDETVLRMTGTTNTYRLRWTEQTVPLGGEPLLRAWEAFATIEINPPRELAALSNNPLGLFIKAFTFTPLAGDKK